MNDLTEPCFVLGGVAQFPENADETPPRDLSGQFGHQLDFRHCGLGRKQSNLV